MTDRGLPPLIRNWKRFYWIVVCWLVLLILLFYAFTQYFG